jgi:outer membrane protein TolC
VRSSWPVVVCLALVSAAGVAQEHPSGAQPIDLPTALRLAGAQNLDVAIARERLAEARAGQESALEQFFPWVSPGASYRAHLGRLQKSEGPLVDVNKQVYVAGAALTAQADLGDAYFKALAARQLVKAADQGLDAQQRDSVLAAAQGYFDLAKAQAGIGVALEAVKISKEYEDQLGQAVAIGIAFKGDELRVRVQTDRERLLVRQAQEEQRVAAARLAQTLHLDPAVNLVPSDADLVPLSLPGADEELEAQVTQALASRPELKRSSSLVAAAEKTQTAAVYGPIIPTLSGQAFGGGLGGGIISDNQRFAHSADFFAGLSWRIGPGGLFDIGRIHAAQSQLRGAPLADEKLKDEITRQVVEANERVRALADQLATVKRQLSAADESLRLTRQRKEFGVGNVLENIQAEQDLTRARNDYVAAIAEYDKAQYALRHATGASAPIRAE